MPGKGQIVRVQKVVERVRDCMEDVEQGQPRIRLPIQTRAMMRQSRFGNSRPLTRTRQKAPMRPECDALDGPSAGLPDKS